MGLGERKEPLGDNVEGQECCTTYFKQIRCAEVIERGGGGKYKTAKLKPTNVPYGRYTFATGKMVRPYNRYMGGTDMWDKLRMALFYSIEAVSHCHKWWQKCFWGLVDGALVNAFICWRSVDPSRRTHMKFMLSLHQALVNNQFDTTGTWVLWL